MQMFIHAVVFGWTRILPRMSEHDNIVLCLYLWQTQSKRANKMQNRIDDVIETIFL